MPIAVQVVLWVVFTGLIGGALAVGRRARLMGDGSTERRARLVALGVLLVFLAYRIITGAPATRLLNGVFALAAIGLIATLRHERPRP